MAFCACYTLTNMLSSRAARLLRPSFLHAWPCTRELSCCAAETATQGAVPAQPGSVSEFHQHVLLQLPRPGDGSSGDGGGCSWWPPMIEK